LAGLLFLFLIYGIAASSREESLEEFKNERTSKRESGVGSRESGPRVEERIQMKKCEMNYN
jgi:hypothetical protein